MSKKTDKKEMKEIKKDLKKAFKRSHDHDLEENDKATLKKMIRFSNEEMKDEPLFTEICTIIVKFEENQVVKCAYCGEDLVLKKDTKSAGLEFYHDDCWKKWLSEFKQKLREYQKQKGISRNHE